MQSSKETRKDQLLKLISAVAYRDAQVEDISAQIKEEGFDALDAMLTLVARASRVSIERARAQARIDLAGFSKPTAPDLVAKTVHPVPHVPFIVDGTVYDPQDISRFKGKELHIIAAQAGSPFVAVEDREVIARWWELTYLSSLALLSLRTANVQEGRHQHIGTRDYMGGILSPPKGSDGPEGFGHPSAGLGVPDNQVVFYSDANYAGDDLSLNKNRGYARLSEVGRGFLGLSDWNDVISSFQCGYGINVCVLYEHKYNGGSTFSALGTSDLTEFGWNDRASSAGCW